MFKNQIWRPKSDSEADCCMFQMCPRERHSNTVKAYYISDDIQEIILPDHLSDLPELGDIEETGIIGYIIIANGQELTIITNEEEYLTWFYELHQ